MLYFDPDWIFLMTGLYDAAVIQNWITNVIYLRILPFREF